MLVAIKSLPARSMLNITGICSTVKPLFSSSKPCTDVSVSPVSLHCIYFRRIWNSEKMEITQRFGLMFTCEWPADSNLCPGCYYWLPWRCNIRLKQVQGLAGQIVLKQPYGPVVHFTACNYQKQTCFAPLCTTALYISVTPSISCPRVLFDHFWLKNVTLSFCF